VKEALATLLPPVSLGRIHSASPASATAIVIRPAMRNVTGAPRVSPRIRVDLFNQLNAGKRIDLDAQCAGSVEPEPYGMDGYVPAALRGMQPLGRARSVRSYGFRTGRAGGRAGVGTNSVRRSSAGNGPRRRGQRPADVSRADAISDVRQCNGLRNGLFGVTVAPIPPDCRRLAMVDAPMASGRRLGDAPVTAPLPSKSLHDMQRLMG
jgi:hypothetical protein